MPRVHILPKLPDGPDEGDGGIRQVVRAQHEFLPAFGWEVTDDPEIADVLALHVDVPPTYLRLYGEKPIVVHNHGAYWTPDYPWWDWSYEANQRVLESLRVADITTAVSEWTAHTLRRHSNRDIRVVHHGVDLDEWPVIEDAPRDYVLWNKTRIDPICDPRPVLELAAQMQEVEFVTTMMPPNERQPFNVTDTGKLPYDEAKRYVQGAGVYLCTTRETFGIGTLEALASGVPVVGYAWGGQREIIEHGVDGWLVQPDDIDGLMEGVRWALGNREAQEAARQKAEQFPAQESVGKYAAIYDEAMQRRAEERPKVSVIVPAYNLVRYLPSTLDSILRQDMDDWECVIVDDASPDECGEIADAYAQRDPRFRVIHNETNQYLAGARNTGIAAARGRYILPLDADDMITSNTLSTLSEALDRYRGLHIVYGNVMFVDEDGRTPTHYPNNLDPGHSGWPVEFRLDWMLMRPGQPMPYASMYRREMWELIGGYRTRARSSEDCEMWLRATSYGFVPQMVTQADMLIYRNREGSMSRDEGWQEHRGWYPWTRDPKTIPAAAYRGAVPGHQIPFPALDPVISVVIPVGPGHEKYVMDAIDSVDAQTFRLWECIVVNDTGGPLPPMPQWVKEITPHPNCANCGREDHPNEHCEARQERFGGTAAARNVGIKASQGALFLPLDADDFLQPVALELMLQAHMDDDEHRPIVYSDFLDELAPGESKVYECPDYDPRSLIPRGLGRAVTALTPKRYWEAVGGYDENVAWEDWAFAISCAAKGFCERRVAAPLFTYRKWTGARRDQNLSDFEESKRSIMAKDFGTQGGELMACSACPGGRSTTYGAPGSYNPAPQQAPAALAPDGTVLVEYTGNKAGTVQYRSEVPGQAPYRFSATQRQVHVRPEDLPYFEAHQEFRIPGPSETAAASPTDIASVPVLEATGPPRRETPDANPEGLPWLGPPPSDLPGADHEQAPSPSAAAVAVAEPPSMPSPEPPVTAAMSIPDETSAASAPAAMPPPDGVPADDLSVVRRQAEQQQQQQQQEDPEVTAKVSGNSRDELNAEALGLGIELAPTMSTKADVARAIIGVRRAATSGDA